jgi:limonene-1,2-epoxide hydrolase
MAGDLEQTLRSFIGEWGKGPEAIATAFRRYMAPDCVWEQNPVPTTRSAEEAVALLRDFNAKAGVASFPADIRQMVVKGNVAFAERVDHLRRADGTLIASVPVTGVFEFNTQGKITAWREYFDSAPVLAVMGQGSQAK